MQTLYSYCVHEEVHVRGELLVVVAAPLTTISEIGMHVLGYVFSEVMIELSEEFLSKVSVALVL